MAHKKRKKQRNDDVRGLIDDAREESSAVASASRDVRSPEPQNNADSLRGERTLLAVPEMDMNSDEEGPEDVLLAKGKDQAIEQKRKEIQAVKRVKCSIKQRRRLKAELFKKQKERKRLKNLRKFPEMELEEALLKISEKKTAAKVNPKKGDRQLQQASERPTSAQIGSIKVILGPSSKETGDSAVGYERACKFLEEALYGDHHERIPVLTQLAKKYRNKPALNFITTK